MPLTTKFLGTACLMFWGAGLAGCTTDAWYESTRQAAQAQCRKQPPGVADECLARQNKAPYSSYEKERSGLGSTRK